MRAREFGCRAARLGCGSLFDSGRRCGSVSFRAVVCMRMKTFGAMPPHTILDLAVDAGCDACSSLTTKHEKRLFMPTQRGCSVPNCEFSSGGLRCARCDVVFTSSFASLNSALLFDGLFIHGVALAFRGFGSRLFAMDGVFDFRACKV